MPHTVLGTSNMRMKNEYGTQTWVSTEKRLSVASLSCRLEVRWEKPSDLGRRIPSFQIGDSKGKSFSPGWPHQGTGPRNVPLDLLCLVSFTSEIA